MSDDDDDDAERSVSEVSERRSSSLLSTHSRCEDGEMTSDNEEGN